MTPALASRPSGILLVVLAAFTVSLAGVPGDAGAARGRFRAVVMKGRRPRPLPTASSVAAMTPEQRRRHFRSLERREAAGAVIGAAGVAGAVPAVTWALWDTSIPVLLRWGAVAASAVMMIGGLSYG